MVQDGMDMDYKAFLAESAKRRAEVKKLRSIGWTWRKIGEALRITPQRAQQLGKANGK